MLYTLHRNINKVQTKHLKTIAINTTDFVLFTLTGNYFTFYKNDLINDDCSDLMSCFQYFLGLGISVICT